jgi:hypothetical protein
MKKLPILFSRSNRSLTPYAVESYNHAKQRHSVNNLKRMFEKRSPRFFKFTLRDILLSSLKESKPIYVVHWSRYSSLRNVQLYNRFQLMDKINRERHIQWIWSMRHLKI